MVGRERIADGEGEQRQLLELPGPEGSGGAAGTTDVGAGVPEERAVRGDTAAAGHCRAAGVQVLGNGETGAAEAVQEAVPWRRRRDPDEANLTCRQGDFSFTLGRLISCEIVRNIPCSFGCSDVCCLLFHRIAR